MCVVNFYVNNSPSVLAISSWLSLCLT